MRIRGFEKVSQEQLRKDIENYNIRIEDINIILPKRGTPMSAGYDFFALFDYILKKGEKMVVPTGIKAYMREGEYLGIVIRSGLGIKKDIRLCNQLGVIDSDYYNNQGNEGHILIAIKNEGEQDFEIKKGERIAQGIFQTYLVADNDDIQTKERIGGLGSTG